MSEGQGVLQVVIPAWYSEDLTQEMQDLACEADKLVPALIGARDTNVAQLSLSRGEWHAPSASELQEAPSVISLMAYTFLVFSFVACAVRHCVLSKLFGLSLSLLLRITALVYLSSK